VRCCENGKPVVRRRAQCLRASYVWEVAGLPNRAAGRRRAPPLGARGGRGRGHTPNTAKRNQCFTHLALPRAGRAEGVVGDEPAAPRRTNPGTSCLSTLTAAALCGRVHVARRQPLSGELSVRHPRKHKNRQADRRRCSPEERCGHDAGRWRRGRRQDG
jgi:hypothetical protein